MRADRTWNASSDENTLNDQQVNFMQKMNWPDVFWICFNGIKLSKWANDNYVNRKQRMLQKKSKQTHQMDKGDRESDMIGHNWLTMNV